MKYDGFEVIYWVLAVFCNNEVVLNGILCLSTFLVDCVIRYEFSIILFDKYEVYNMSKKLNTVNKDNREPREMFEFNIQVKNDIRRITFKCRHCRIRGYRFVKIF